MPEKEECKGKSLDKLFKETAPDLVHEYAVPMKEDGKFRIPKYPLIDGFAMMFGDALRVYLQGKAYEIAETELREVTVEDVCTAYKSFIQKIKEPK